MSTDFYNYQYRRPRLNNPTFLSNSVASTFSFYSSSKVNEKYKNPPIEGAKIGRYQPQGKNYNKEENNRQSSLVISQSDYLLPKIDKKVDSSLNELKSVKNRSNSSHLQKYGQNILQANEQLSSYQNLSSKQRALVELLKQRKNASVIEELNKNPSLLNFNEKDIFMKQDHNYNIITYQPKNYHEYIKKYPKLSQQQKDQYFRMRYINDDKIKNSLYKTKNLQTQHMDDQRGRQLRENVYQQQKMAGMHTYKLPGTKNQNQQIKNQHKQQENKAQKNQRKNFDMKLLNNMDELNYIS